MNKSKSLRVMTAASVLFLLTVAPFTDVHALTNCGTECYNEFGLINHGGPDDPTDNDTIALHFDLEDLVPVGSHTAVIGNVVAHYFSGPSNDVFGDWEISYNTANPAPPCTLLSVSPGPDLFPAILTLPLSWVLVSDSFPPLRTISPVILVSEPLNTFPEAIMNYIAVTDVYWQEVSNPGDTVLMLPTAGVEVIATHQEAVVPTLTEWGMIIFSVLLFGWMAWVIVRRRKRVAVGI